MSTALNRVVTILEGLEAGCVGGEVRIVKELNPHFHDRKLLDNS